MSKTINICPETYNTFLKMLNSEDRENSAMALINLENVNFNKNISKILLLKKRSLASPKEWKENAPKTIKKIKSLGLDIETIYTYKEIFKIITDPKYKTSNDCIDFFLADFSNHIKEKYIKLGFDFLEDVEIIIKPKLKNE